jgi:hypothetical protein
MIVLPGGDFGLVLSILTVQISPLVLWFSRAFQETFNPHSAIRDRPGGNSFSQVLTQICNELTYHRNGGN